ncbi:MAG: hypothetical protein ACLFVO_04835, partial [Chloroflexaceae bacterium]
VQKKKAYHAAAGESGHYRAQTPSLQTYGVTHISDMSYAVPDLTGNVAAGRAEDPRCRRRRLPLWAYISAWYTHRVTRVSELYIPVRKDQNPYKTARKIGSQQ